MLLRAYCFDRPHLVLYWALDTDWFLKKKRKKRGHSISKIPLKNIQKYFSNVMEREQLNGFKQTRIWVGVNVRVKRSIDPLGWSLDLLESLVYFVSKHGKEPLIFTGGDNLTDVADVACRQTCKIISFTSLRPEKCKNTSDAPLPVGGASEADATTN